VRNLIQSPEYARIFPNTKIASDAKAAAQWNTTAGGEYFAIGVGGALAGRGAHLIIADDPLSEQDIKAGNTNSLDTVYEWFSAGLRTRLMPDGKICVLHTRWHQRDLIGRLLKDSAMNEGGDSYEAFEFPAILNAGTENEMSIWPDCRKGMRCAVVNGTISTFTCMIPAMWLATSMSKPSYSPALFSDAMGGWSA
jgi:hypothetical protein